jgi:hypothetical protein
VTGVLAVVLRQAAVEHTEQAALDLRRQFIPGLGSGSV